MQRNCVALVAFLFVGLACSQVVAAEPGPVDAELPEFTTTDSGLRYRVLREGEGELPTTEDTVSVHYRGWLNNGSVFDDSYARSRPATFKVTDVVAGWQEGLQHVREGGMIELEIPASLGYGAAGAGRDIPPNSSLYFLVELIDIK